MSREWPTHIGTVCDTVDVQFCLSVNKGACPRFVKLGEVSFVKESVRCSEGKQTDVEESLARKGQPSREYEGGILHDHFHRLHEDQLKTRLYHMEKKVETDHKERKTILLAHKYSTGAEASLLARLPAVALEGFANNGWAFAFQKEGAAAPSNCQTSSIAPGGT